MSSMPNEPLSNQQLPNHLPSQALSAQDLVNARGEGEPLWDEPRRSWWSVVAAAVALVAAVALFQPLALLGLHAAGVNTDPGPSCTMERAAECTFRDGPGMVATFFEIVVVVGLMVLVAALAGGALLVSILITARARRLAARRPPVVRAALGTFLVTFAATGVFQFVASSH